ncbi:carbohydrate-binding protein [Actinomadura darangshiensis]|uniref:Carbohydrate-binding protein n=1 Tax=Actinomadura darangshiensis TaxID=705336 RepID=A0A4R5ANJ0_9ACTN|nr:carbohydrate-binding protein [Actinomadura darangshiensis]TDD73310.1 carbohydrate-binding protein [Actinomadura darangshiensis]
MQRRTLLACAVLATFTAVPATSATASPASGPSASGPSASSPDPRAPKHGRVAGARDFTPNARNAKAVERFRDLHRSRLRREQIHHFWGVEPAAGTHDGMQATHSVDTSYQVSNSADFTYTPTIKAAGSCMEVTTVYSQAVGNEIWAWDWCGGNGPAKEVKMDASFVQTYTKPVNGHPAYSVQLVQTNASTNAWSAYLYNYATGSWSLFYSKSGSDTSQLTYGWDIFEIYATRDPGTGNAYYCDDAKNVVFESSSIQLRRNGSWTPASPSDSPWQPTANPNPSDYLCPSLQFVKAGSNDHWIVQQ